MYYQLGYASCIIYISVRACHIEHSSPGDKSVFGNTQVLEAAKHLQIDVLVSKKSGQLTRQENSSATVGSNSDSTVPEMLICRSPKKLRF